MPGTSGWQIRDGEQIIACNKRLLGRRHFSIGITRIRNEALILQDALDYVGGHVDAIVAYDDASTDRTLEILGGHPKVALIVANRSWEADIEARRIAEGRHRGLLLQIAREHFQFEWMFCFDPDERVTGDMRGFMEQTHSSECDGVRVRLFDAYMTPEDQAPYQANRELLGFRRFSRSRTAKHSNDAAKPVGGHFRKARWTRAGWSRPRGDRSLLPTLWQVVVSRALGRDLRLLHATLSVRYLWTKMERPQGSSNPHTVRLHAALVRMG
jgi:hypothetical protein